MATSPNYGWAEPDNTDLVKNGALAIRTAVNAIDTSMAELLGGTTGQVLSKTSNTNMDFTWVTTDDTNAIQNAIVDAKGDLIAATANDTPARLAVGADGTVLQAASGQSTGLQWVGAFGTYATSVSNISIGNGTTSLRYRQIGKLVDFNFTLTFGSTTTISSSPNFTLPVAPTTSNSFSVALLDSGTGWFPAFAITSSSTCFLDLMTASGTYVGTGAFSSTAPFTWATGDKIVVNGSYEVA
jgi:hypothetical protein